MLHEMKTDMLDHHIDMFITSSIDCKYPCTLSAKSWSRQPDVEQTVAGSAHPAGMGRSFFFGATIHWFLSGQPQQQRQQHPLSLWDVLGRCFLLLADGKRTRESVVAGLQGILGWGVALQNINSLQLFNVIQTCEAEFVFTGCKCSSTFLHQMSVLQGTGILLRF